MGVDIDDLQDRNRTISASWWRWRPTVELMRASNLFTDERLGYLADGIGELTQQEAQQIADHFESQVLPGISQGQRILLDGTVTNVPDDGKFHRVPQEQHKNYSADYEWLVKFTAFCRQSHGLYIC